MDDTQVITEAANKANRKKVEFLIYKIMDILDPTGKNKQWYMTKFSKMSDTAFYKFFQQEFPIKFQMEAFDIEPKMNQMFRAADELKIPVMEKVYMPFLYRNKKDNDPVESNYEALVVYLPLKKTKQFLNKKNSMSIDKDMRNAKTGRLISKDKNGNMSDREFESLAVMDLPNTMREFSTFRADAMQAKDQFYATIAEKNMVSLDDIDVSKRDSIARNTLNAYLIGAGIMSNLITIGKNDSYMLPSTVDTRTKVRRES